MSLSPSSALRQQFNRVLLGVVLPVTTLSGCATMRNTSTTDCIERQGFSVSIPLLGRVDKRNDSFNQACATARAASTIAGMRKADGTPDMNTYTLAVTMYEQSNPQVREFMDKMLREQGTTIEALRFEVDSAKEPVVCERVAGTDGSSNFRCAPKAQAR